LLRRGKLEKAQTGIENTLTKEIGDEVSLKKGAEVKVIIEAWAGCGTAVLFPALSSRAKPRDLSAVSHF
jgi:hypothetical protein